MTVVSKVFGLHTACLAYAEESSYRRSADVVSNATGSTVTRTRTGSPNCSKKKGTVGRVIVDEIYISLWISVVVTFATFSYGIGM